MFIHTLRNQVVIFSIYNVIVYVIKFFCLDLFLFWSVFWVPNIVEMDPQNEMLLKNEKIKGEKIGRNHLFDFLTQPPQPAAGKIMTW